MRKIMSAILMAFLCVAVFAQNTANDFTVDPQGTITKYEGWDAQVVIPCQIGNTVIRAIGPGVFKSADLTGVTIPDSVKYIGDWAFMEMPIDQH